MKYLYIILFLIISFSLSAQPYKAYITMHYNPVQRAAWVYVGDSIIILKDVHSEAALKKEFAPGANERDNKKE